MVIKPKSKASRTNLDKTVKERLIFFLLWGLLGFSIIITLSIGLWYFRTPQVTAFSWENIKVGVEDKQFTLTFNREMDHESVANNLRFKPPLAGDITWEEETLTYTLSEIPLYGNTYFIQISNAVTAERRQLIQPFIEEFKTRDRAFVYLGIEAEEKGRLILNNLTQQEKIVLSPANLTVVDFELYPEGNRLLFSAIPRQSEQEEDPPQKLYTVTTGINPKGSDQSPGKVEVILDAKVYQNRKFDLSANGKTIVVQRLNRENPQESGLWIILEDQKPVPLNIQSENFVISPDGRNLAATASEGVTVTSLNSEATSSFLFPEYNHVVSFTPDGESALMVKDNQQETRSLFLVNQERERQLSTTDGSILDCDFEPKQQQSLYCLQTELVEADGIISEEPYLANINLETAQSFPLLALPNYPNVKMSIAPDGIAILFDQVVAKVPDINDELITEKGEAIVTGQLWLLPLPESNTEERRNRIPPEEIVAGFNPHWLP